MTQRVAAGAVLCVLAAVLVHTGAIVDAMHSIPDYVSPLVLAHDAHLYPDSTVMLGNYAWYPGFWSARAVGTLGDGVNSVLPLLLTLAVTAAVAVQARRVWGTVAALLFAGLALSVGTEAWTASAAWSVRATSWWAMAFAGLTVVAAASGHRRAALAGAAATVVWGGLCLSGDKLVYAVIVAPLAAAAVAAFARGAVGLAGQAAGLAAGLVVSGAVFTRIAEAADVVPHPYPLVTTPFEQFGTYAGYALTALTQVWTSPGSSVTGPATAYVAAAAVLGALAAAPAVLRGTDDVARTVWTAFWTAAALGNIAAFVLNASSVINGLSVPRYLYALPLAAGAVLAAVAGSGRARRLAPAAVVLACLGTAISFFSDPPVRNAVAHTAASGSVLAAARERGLERGFGSYQTVYAMEQKLGYAVALSPVGPCAQGVCPFYLHRNDGAYRPQSGRSFLLVDHSPMASAQSRDWLTAGPPGVQAVESVDVGDGLEMLVYDHDVAQHFGPPMP